MRKKMTFTANTSLACLCLLLVAGHAAAVTSSTSSRDDTTAILEEITVTATRQSIGVQSTPITVTAISSQDLKDQGITDLAQLTQVAPSMFVQEGIAAGSPRFSLRGISTTDVTYQASSPVAIYVDDVYQASLFGMGTQLFDLGRVEVLYGPQGTLFGKNTTGGAVSYFSQTPTNKLEGYVTMRVASGDQSDRGVEGAINVPIIDQVLVMRLSFKTEDFGDYIHDVNLNKNYGHSETQAGRVQLQWTPAEKTTVNLTISGSSRRGDSPIYHTEYLNPCASAQAAVYLCNPVTGTPLPAPPLNPDTVAYPGGIPYDENFDNESNVLRIDHGFGGFTLTSITNYGFGKWYDVQYGSAGPGDLLDLYALVKHRQIGEELRLASDPKLRLSGVGGLFFMNDHLTSRNSYASTQLGVPFTYNQQDSNDMHTKTYAVFGNLTLRFTDALSVIGGVRKSIERRTHDGVSNYYFPFANTYPWTPYNVLPIGPAPVPPNVVLPYAQAEKSSPVTWDGTINYQPRDTFMVYARVAQGFRSGGFNPAAYLTPVAPPPYGPETLRSYEIGFKSDWLAHTLRINGAAFHYIFHDQQVSTIIDSIPVTSNAGAAKVDGGELEIKALPITHLELGGSLSYTRAVFTNHGIYTGNTLAQAPKITANGSLAYTFDVSDKLSLRASTVWDYRSRVYFDYTNNPAISAGGLTRGNVRLELQPQSGEGFSIAAFVNNLTNRKYVVNAFTVADGAGVPLYNAAIYAPGIAYGVDLSCKW